MSGYSQRAIAQQLRMWRQAGVERILADHTASEQAVAESDEHAAPSDVGLVDSAEEAPPVFSTDGDDARTAALAVIQQEVRQCTCCKELVANRTQTVFGVGSVRPRLCFLGEAPGADEDRQGIPFVGRSGQLLTRIIEACTLRRDDVYILNVVKCRPPGNRNPTEEEIRNCQHFYEQQLEILQPEFICCLGSVAATSLLQTKSSLGRLRGRLHQWRDCQVVVTYHPSYLLRNPAAKKDTWEDMQMLMKAMGIDIPAT